MTIKWAELPCGVPGYALTAGAYAAMIQETARLGRFSHVALFVASAEKAGSLVRIEMAAQEKVISETGADWQALQTGFGDENEREE